MTSPALPARKKKGTIVKRIYDFKEFLTATEEEIKDNQDIFIDDFNLLIENFDFLERIIDKGSMIEIYSPDYKILEYINNNCKSNNKYTVSLVNDNEMKNRDYIHPEEFEKSRFVIPMHYLLWQSNCQSDAYISGLTTNYGNGMPATTNGYNTMEFEKIKQIKEIVSQLGEECKGLDEIDKIILVSNYLQRRVQYVERNNVSYADHVYITDSKGLEITSKLSDSGDNVILNKFGVCCGIANATTLLLNNQDLQVNAQNVAGQNHLWNCVQVNNKWYYIDNTWNITRNPNRFEESLKAKSFSGTYLLFGTDMAKTIGHHQSEYREPLIEQESYDTGLIRKRVRDLSKKHSFDNYEEPVFKSHIQR